MKLLCQCKTKDVYALEDGNYLLKFKELAGDEGAPAPGADAAGSSAQGMGCIRLLLSEYFFRCVDEAGYPTHFISADIEKSEMTVLPTEKPGKGLEVICRYRAVGSFIKRYGGYVREGQALDALFEVNLKDEERGNPAITRETLDMLGIISGDEYNTLKFLTKRISGVIRDELESKELELNDVTLEFGYYEEDFILIGEISGENLRVCKEGKLLNTFDLAAIMLD